MRQDEKLSYLIVKATLTYQLFLLATNAATIDVTINMIKSMKIGARFVTLAATIMALKAQIIELKD